MGKSENSGFFRNYCSYSDLKVGRSSHLIEFMKLCEYRRSRSFLYHETFHETWYVASGTPAHHSLFK